MSLLLLTEDSSNNALLTMKCLVSKMLQCIDSSVGTHRIDFEPVPESAGRAMRANRWNCTTGANETEIRELVRGITTKLLEEKCPGFVMFHFDGDTTWSNKNDSSNLRKFEKDFLVRLRSALMSHLRDATKVESALTKLIPVVPHYSKEAWLYQNFEIALEICNERGFSSDVEKIMNWMENPDVLEELNKPKDLLRLGDKYNHNLVNERFPIERMKQNGKSFGATLKRMKECRVLVNAIRSTYLVDDPSTSSTDQ